MTYRPYIPPSNKPGVYKRRAEQDAKREVMRSNRAARRAERAASGEKGAPIDAEAARDQSRWLAAEASKAATPAARDILAEQSRRWAEIAELAEGRS